jgi:hypothetical protein
MVAHCPGAAPDGAEAREVITTGKAFVVEDACVQVCSSEPESDGKQKNKKKKKKKEKSGEDKRKKKPKKNRGRGGPDFLKPDY